MLIGLKPVCDFFCDYKLQAKGENFKRQDLSVEDGREYTRYLMDRKTRYKDHPMNKEREGKLKL